MRRRLSAALLALSCSDPAAPERVDVPYDGQPFPDRRPRFELPETDLGVVSNSGSDTLSLLDLENRSVIGSAPVGLDPVELDGPHHVALDRPAGAVYTALSYPPPTLVPGPHAAHGSSRRNGFVQKLALESLTPLAQAEVDVNPGDIVLSRDGSRLFVSHFDLGRVMTETELDARRADVTILDAATLATERVFRTCIAPHAVALSGSAGELAFVACYGEDALAVIDTTGADDPELISVGPGGVPGSPAYGPYALTLSPDDDTIAVSNLASQDLRLFDVEPREFRDGAVLLPGQPYFAAWSPDGAVLYVPTQGVDALVVVSPEQGSIQGTLYFEADECVRPHVAAFASDPEVLFLVCEGDHETPSTVLALDVDSLAMIDRLEVGVYPDAIAIAGPP